MAGVNAVIRSVVRTTIHYYGSEVVGIMNGFEGLLQPPQVRSLGLKDVQSFPRYDKTLLGAAPRGNPFQQKVNGEIQDRSKEIQTSFQWLGLDCLICIGGIGTVSLAQKVSELGIPIIAIPKSTTNELMMTDESVGFSTAVGTAVEVLDRLHNVKEQSHRVIYAEVMGREAGWTALMAGVAGGAHVILIPEIPYREEQVLAAIDKRVQKGRSSTLIVVAAGAHRTDEAPRAKHQHTAQDLASRLHHQNGLEYELVLLGPVQRGGPPASRDRFLAMRMGSQAVKAAHDGHHKHMVGIKEDRIALVPLDTVKGQHKLVDPHSPVVWTALSQGICMGVAEQELTQPDDN